MFAFIPTIGFRSIIFFAILLPLVLFSFFWRKWRARGLFPYLTGSASAWVILSASAAIKSPGANGNAFLLAAAIVVIVFFWKFIFGPWNSEVKAATLGTFIFWIAVNLLLGRAANERVGTLLAVIVAVIPASVWCWLFRRWYKKRISVVLLSFFAGCLSTAPILFYDMVVKSGVELHFFLFRIVPENFFNASRTFVTGALTGDSGVLTASVATTLVSFGLVGVIEEWSKHWVTKKSDPAYFSSINDVIQLSIIAAIGFAFAENIVNPSYFLAFVQNYLVTPASPRWGLFLGSVLGRSLITNMVHITCSGVLGFFYGRAFFAKYAMEDDRARGRRHPFIIFLNRLTGASRIQLFREASMMLGLFIAILLHAGFDVSVSLPAVLPGNPQTLGELVSFAGPFGGISFVFLPAFLYVVGGFALLTYLFRKKEDRHEYGYHFHEEVFVPVTPSRVS